MTAKKKSSPIVGKPTGAHRPKRKTTTVDNGDVMEFYRVFPVCPHCYYENEIETEALPPDYFTCQACKKTSKIKYI